MTGTACGGAAFQAAGAGGSTWATGAPQELQKLAAFGFCMPHWEQKAMERTPRVWESLPQGGEAMLFEAFMEHAVIWNPLIIAAQNAD